MLALVLPRHWHLKLFLRPHDCINYLQQEPPFWEADAWNQQQLVEHWREGKPLIRQLLGYWSKYTERYALTRVCVVDYSMPAMDGLQTLGELADWPGSRVLLTGPGGRAGRGQRIQPRPDRPVHRQADARHLAPADRRGGKPDGRAQPAAFADLARHADTAAKRVAARALDRMC